MLISVSNALTLCNSSTLIFLQRSRHKIFLICFDPFLNLTKNSLTEREDLLFALGSLNSLLEAKKASCSLRYVTKFIGSPVFRLISSRDKRRLSVAISETFILLIDCALSAGLLPENKLQVIFLVSALPLFIRGLFTI